MAARLYNTASERGNQARGFRRGCQELGVHWKGHLVSRKAQLSEGLLSYCCSPAREKGASFLIAVLEHQHCVSRRPAQVSFGR